MKKVISLILSVAFIFVSIPDISHAEEAYDGGNAAKIMAEIMDINAALSKFGLTLADFKKFAEKDQSFFEDLKQILIDSPTAPEITFKDENGASEGEAQTFAVPASVVAWRDLLKIKEDWEISDDSINDGNMWDYAHEMAVLNKERDPDAKDISAETRYMYMSHYIDIKTGPRYKVDKNISNESYFSAWIVNEDRAAYELYLGGTYFAKDLIDKADVFSYLVSMRADVSGLLLNDLNQARNISIDIANTFDIGFQTELQLESLFKRLSYVGNDAKAFVNHVRDTLKPEDYGTLTRSAAVGIVCALVASAGVLAAGVLLSAAISAMSFHSHVVKDYFDRIWWYGLIASNSMRVAGRYMRYFGM